MKRIQQVSLSLFLLLCLLLSACGAAPGGTQTSFSLEDVPAFSGEPYVVLSDNQPGFTQEELDQAAQGFEEYSPLDTLGRCGTAYASVGLDTMPTQDRESISSVKPSGWQTAKYDTELVDGGYLYNRCHLIGFQRTGENANEENLITGTRYLNVEGMLPFENLVADYVKETGNHVLYRVTPVFSGTELVARGVELEALSVEDGGEGVCFHVYCYNNQPGIAIDYATGESWLDGEEPQSSGSGAASSSAGSSSGETGAETEQHYVLNTNSKKFQPPGLHRHPPVPPGPGVLPLRHVQALSRGVHIKISINRARRGAILPLSGPRCPCQKARPIVYPFTFTESLQACFLFLKG